MITSKWRFEAAGRRFRMEARFGMADVQMRLMEGETTLAERSYAGGEPEALDPQSLAVDLPEGRLEVTIGAIGWWTMACQARLNGALVYRSKKEDFRPPQALQAMLTANASTSPEEKAARVERAKARMPSIYVDVAMGVLFFIVARQTPDWQLMGVTLTGLQTAALAGAGVTLLLFVVQRFVRVDLLGGLAVFGVVMALISAGLAIAFQDDLFVKLRGTFVGLIGATFFLVDGLAGGRYLGKRLVGYLETLVRLSPQRASFALAGAGAAVAVIDLGAAFALPTDVWLIYNSFLDAFVAMPIVLAAFWFARDRPSR